MNDYEETGIAELDRRFPVKYGSGDLVGLGQFIVNIMLAPSDGETDAENIALAVIAAFDADKMAYAKKTRDLALSDAAANAADNE